MPRILDAPLTINLSTLAKCRHHTYHPLVVFLRRLRIADKALELLENRVPLGMFWDQVLQFISPTQHFRKAVIADTGILNTANRRLIYKALQLTDQLLLRL